MKNKELLILILLTLVFSSISFASIFMAPQNSSIEENYIYIPLFSGILAFAFGILAIMSIARSKGSGQGQVLRKTAFSLFRVSILWNIFGFIIIVVLIAFLINSIGDVNISSPTTENTEDSGWQTFKSDEMNIQFSYPFKNYEVREVGNNEVIVSAYPAKDYPLSRVLAIEMDDREIEDYINDYNYNAKQFCRLRVGEDSIEKTGDFSVGEINGFKLTECTAFGPDKYLIFLRNGDKSYIIDYSPNEQVHEQIISTLQFIPGNAIREYLENEFPPNLDDKGETFCAYDYLGDQKNDNLTNAFLWVFCADYYVDNGVLGRKSASSGPVKLTIKKEDSSYSVFSYEIPEDGEGYTQSVRNIFPEDYYDDIFLQSLDYSLYNQRSSRLDNEVEERAKGYFQYQNEETGSFLEVIYPNGGEELVAGNSYEIQWQSTGMEGKKLKLSLALPGHGWLVIDTFPSESGGAVWKIPQDIDPGKYKIFLSWPTNVTASYVEVSDYSDDYFSITKNESVGWGVYRNEEYGFELNCPEGWEAEDNSFLNPSCDLNYYSGIDCSIDFYVSENVDLINLDKWIDDNLYHLYFPRNKEAFFVDEVEGISADITLMHSLSGTLVVFAKNGLVYEFLASEENTPTLYEILSTFSFLE